MTSDNVTTRVLVRDQYQCRNCGKGGINQLHVHHVVYRSQGGKDTEDNLVTLCQNCHVRVHHNPRLFYFAWNGETFEIFMRR